MLKGLVDGLLTENFRCKSDLFLINSVLLACNKSTYSFLAFAEDQLGYEIFE